MTTNYTTLYENGLRRFTLSTLYIMFGLYILGGFLFSLPSPLNFFFLVGGILNVVPIPLVYKIPAVYIKKTIKVYLVIMLIPMYCITIGCLLRGVVTPLFWYIVIPIYLYAVFPHRETVKCAIGCLCLMISALIIVFVMQYTLYDNILIDYPPMTLFQALLTEMVSVFFALLIVCLSLYYINYFQRLKLKQLELTDSIKKANMKNNSILNVEAVEADECAKFDKIYTQIVDYLEADEPYLKHNFKITQMAYKLNLNAADLAKAIRKKDMNFNILINRYRVRKVKELIQKKGSMYTLESIYLSSGFRSQSSFNRAFKQEMGITPSEYYKEIIDGKK